MLASPAISVPLAVVALLACAQAASAQAGQTRRPTASRSISSDGQTAVRKKPPVTRAPAQDEKSWMERASASSGGGSGGGGM
jgi:hypothetical protein